MEIRILINGLIGLAALSLVACGGGGGGGGGGVSYSGATNPVGLDGTNSQPVSENSVMSVSSSDNLGSLTGTGSQNRSQIMGLILGEIRDLAMKSGDAQANSNPNPVAQVIPGSGSYTSQCGGTESYSSSFDDVTYEFTSTNTYSNYCDELDHSILNGVITFNGALNVDTGTLRGTITFSNFSVSANSESFTMSGSTTFSGSIYGGTFDMVMSMDYRDNNGNKTYRVENLAMAITESGSFFTVAITGGKVYHPDYGYVTVVTTTSLSFNATDEFPTSGEIELTGDNSKVTVTYNLDGSYIMVIDEDNNVNTTNITHTCSWAGVCV